MMNKAPVKTPVECPKCGGDLVERVNGDGYKYKQCPQCIADAQRAYLLRHLTDKQLDEKEAKVKRTYLRSMAAIKAARKERAK